jgi:hypothetical protein
MYPSRDIIACAITLPIAPPRSTRRGIASASQGDDDPPTSKSSPGRASVPPRRQRLDVLERPEPSGRPLTRTRRQSPARLCVGRRFTVGCRCTCWRLDVLAVCVRSAEWASPPRSQRHERVPRRSPGSCSGVLRERVGAGEVLPGGVGGQDREPEPSSEPCAGGECSYSSTSQRACASPTTPARHRCGTARSRRCWRATAGALS